MVNNIPIQIYLKVNKWYILLHASVDIGNNRAVLGLNQIYTLGIQNKVIQCDGRRGGIHGSSYIGTVKIRTKVGDQKTTIEYYISETPRDYVNFGITIFSLYDIKKTTCEINSTIFGTVPMLAYVPVKPSELSEQQLLESFKNFINTFENILKCDYCDNLIPIAYFSDRGKNLDFCSQSCYLAWINADNFI